MNNVQEVVMLSMPGVEPDLYYQAIEVLEQNFPGVKFILTNEEFKVVDLEKLQRQLDELQQAIKTLRQEVKEEKPKPRPPLFGDGIGVRKSREYVAQQIYNLDTSNGGPGISEAINMSEEQIDDLVHKILRKSPKENEE